MSRILITGYSSNLGSELISNLLLQGHEIICLGRTKPVGKFKWFPWTLGQNPPKEAFEKVNILLHLAWPTVSRSDITSHLAIGGSERLIRTAEFYGVRIVFISTMSVYAINSVYGAAKKQVESMIGDRNIIVRLGYVVTPRSLLFKLEKIFCKANIAIVPNKDTILRITSVEDFFTTVNRCVNEIETGSCNAPYETYTFKSYLRLRGIRFFIQVPPRLISLVFSVLRFRSQRILDLRDAWNGLT